MHHDARIFLISTCFTALACGDPATPATGSGSTSSSSTDAPAPPTTTTTSGTTTTGTTHDASSEPTTISSTPTTSETTEVTTITTSTSDPTTDPGTGTLATTGSIDACSFKDPDAKLCWQEPPAPGLFHWNDAGPYCESLNLRLPTVQELASLVRGCPSAQCPVEDPGCLSLPCRAAPECQGCAETMGPGPAGCYWDPALTGPCDWYWTASGVDGGPFDAWFIYFQSGSVDYGAQAIEKQVRCVRTDP